MDGLTTCSGITIKMKVVGRQRIKDEQLFGVAVLETVPDVVQYLCAFLPHRKIFGQVGDKDLHRGDIEQHLSLSQYRDFAKFHQLVSIKQRRFLDLYSMHYEITILKTCLRNTVGHREQRQDLSMSRDFFKRHSVLDLTTLSQSQSIEEFIGDLKGFAYYGPLYQTQQNGRVTLPACETALGMLYFRSTWRIKDKCLSKSKQKIIAQCFGIRMNMLNLRWICRSKKFYQLEPGKIYAILAPIQLYLAREEINRMVEVKSLDILYGLIGASWYGKTGLVHLDQDQGLDHPAHDIIDRTYLKTSRKDPYSIAILSSYLYLEERGVRRIITTIEEIRYGLGAS